ncbi:MAG TPA: PIN domain-containing protein [Allosphingosinicella sp.]
MFDTSALREAGWHSSPLSSIFQLSKAGLVEVYLPELVIAERRTQWAEKPREAISGARQALRELASNPITPSQQAQQVNQLLADLSKMDVDEMSLLAFDQFVRDNKIIELPITLEHSKAAWRSYFSGLAPHRKPKNRDDIPDAHIFEAAKELIERKGDVHFVCGDKRLSSALAPLPGARVHASLEELFQSGALEDATNLWSRDQAWRRIEQLAPLDEIKEEIRNQLESDLEVHLHDLDFVDDALPGDETVAHVLWAMGAELIEIENPDDWGGGLMSFQVDCECDAGIRMRYSHEEARGLPDWIDVSWGHGNYVEATADVRLKVETTVDVEVDLSNVEDGLKPLLSRIEMNDPQLFIVQTGPSWST